MPDHLALYGRVRAPLSLSGLEGLAPGAKVRARQGSDWDEVELCWPDASVVLTAVGVGDPTFEKQLASFLSRIGARVASAPEGLALFSGLARTKWIIGLTAPAGLDARSERLARELTRASQGVLARGERLLDAEGRPLLDASNHRSEGSELPRSAAAEARRVRSFQRLARLGLKGPHRLDLLDGDEEAWPREAREVAARAEVLFAVAARGEGLSSDEACALLEGPGLWPYATPSEQAFLRAPHPSPEEAQERVWSYEALWVLLWALGRVEVLHGPTAACDVPRAARCMVETPPATLVREATLRPLGEVLDEADFTCVAAATARAAPHGPFSTGVLIERQRAFRWLLRHWHQPWEQLDLAL